MLEVIIGIAYVTIVCYLTGLLAEEALRKARLLRAGDLCSFTRTIVMGVVFLTVLASLWSICFPVAALFHLVVVALAAFSAWRYRDRVKACCDRARRLACSTEGLFYLLVILAIAFFASRGKFHTDTNIYHAQNIAIYERFGLIRGMANLQQHFGYNSSYLAFASIFSFGWLLPKALHVTTAFLEVVFALDALYGLKGGLRRRRHLADAMRVAMLYYIFVILAGSISPATDYAAMMFALSLMTGWVETLESDAGNTERFALLSVYAVFCLTVKLSGAALVAVVLWPAFLLLREKDLRRILSYLLLGVLCVLPFLIRNYLISGWLIYPSAAIDLFHPVWKVPLDYLTHDAAQITVWGRCLYDVARVNEPMSYWLPIWWDAQERYDQMLLLAAALGGVLFAVVMGRELFLAGSRAGDASALKKGERAALCVLLLAVLLSLAVWFFVAPFVRYGLAFLVTAVLLPAGMWLQTERKGIYAIVTGALIFVTALSVTEHVARYYAENGVFVKQQLMQPYYLTQRPYDSPTSVLYTEMGGEKVYYADYDADGELNAYENCPGTCYEHMLERSTLIGETLRSGFRAK